MSVAGENARDKQASLQDAIHAHYQALFALAVQKRAELGVHLPIVATGHLTTVGASASESVREIYVGSLEAFPTAAFPRRRLHRARAYSPAAESRRTRTYPL